MSPSGPRIPTLSVKALNKKLFFSKKEQFFLTKELTFAMIPLSHLFFQLFLMTTIQKGFYSLVGLAATTASVLAGPFDGKAVTIGGTSQNSAEVTVQNLIDRALMFLSIVAVLYGIWGGFQIITAGGDEEKVKKGRTILIQVVIGIIVVWLAGSVVKWVVGLVVGA
jgi:hypothetical protein